MHKKHENCFILCLLCKHGVTQSRWMAAVQSPAAQWRHLLWCVLSSCPALATVTLCSHRHTHTHCRTKKISVPLITVPLRVQRLQYFCFHEQCTYTLPHAILQGHVHRGRCFYHDGWWWKAWMIWCRESLLVAFIWAAWGTKPLLLSLLIFSVHCTWKPGLLCNSSLSHPQEMFSTLVCKNISWARCEQAHVYAQHSWFICLHHLYEQYAKNKRVIWECKLFSRLLIVSETWLYL